MKMNSLAVKLLKSQNESERFLLKVDTDHKIEKKTFPEDSILLEIGEMKKHDLRIGDELFCFGKDTGLLLRALPSQDSISLVNSIVPLTPLSGDILKLIPQRQIGELTNVVFCHTNHSVPPSMLKSYLKGQVVSLSTSLRLSLFNHPIDLTPIHCHPNIGTITTTTSLHLSSLPPLSEKTFISYPSLSSLSKNLIKNIESHSTLLIGPTGQGKTTLAISIMHQHFPYSSYLHCSHLFQGKIGQSEQTLRSLFTKNSKNRNESKNRIVIVLDSIEMILSPKPSKRGEHRVESLLRSELIQLMDEFRQVRVLGITDLSVKDLEGEGLLFGRFERVLEMKVPSLTERKVILRGIFDRYLCEMGETVEGRGASEKKKRKLCEKGEAPEVFLQEKELEVHAEATPGTTLSDLLSYARLCFENRLSLVSTSSKKKKKKGEHDRYFFQPIFDGVPSTLQEFRESSTNFSPLRFSDLAGLEDVIKLLRYTLLSPFTNRKKTGEKKNILAKVPRGILLYGPPGCGKTSVGRAIGTELGFLGCNFLCVDATNIISKVVGESARRLGNVFRSARSGAPCVIFLDQFEVVGRTRNIQHRSFDHMLSTLLVEMDGVVNSSSKEIVILIAATNRKDLLDSAVLRPGRLDHHIKIPKPSEESRRKIVSKLTEDMPFEFKRDGKFLNIFVKMTEGFSTAEMKNVVRESAMVCLRENMENEKISLNHVLKAFEAVGKRKK